MSETAQVAERPAAPVPARQIVRDAATLILLDRSGDETKVLMGRRHEGVKFMPGKFVFPGGRVEPADGRVNISGAYAPHVERRLQERVQRPSITRARAYGLAAIRELAEETGLLIGDRESGPFTAPGESWQAFADAEVFPTLEGLWFVCRAVTPPGRPRRFDTRFFAADAALIAARVEGVVTADAELVELVWTSLKDAHALDLPAITRIVLKELESRIEEGLESDLPVPFYKGGSASARELI